MAPQAKPLKPRVSLRGYERTFAMADNGSLKIVHAMTVRGPEDAIAAFFKRLPQALVLTFNRHPRMRATQVKGEFAMAEIQPKVTLDTLTQKKLLAIRETSGDESWEKFVEDEWQIPFDRYSELPFYVRVWHYPGQSLARVLLFSDHYVSDGISGMAVLNDVVTFASELSREEPQEASEKLTTGSEELPLRPPLYDMWLRPKPLSHFLGKVLVKLFGKMLYVGEVQRFHPIIELRADQADLMVPVQINSSSALFAQGTTENMKNALQRCKDEGVTFFGALAAATVVSYYMHCDDDKRSVGSQSFKLTLELPVNMRPRVPSPAPEVQVGAYMASGELESFSKEGVVMDTVIFWDLARKSKHELDELLEGVVMPLSLLFLDKYVNANLTQEFLKGVHVRHSAVSDINISNVGRYAYKTTHTFQTATDGLEDLTIDSVHVGNSIPHAGPAANVYISSTDKLSYGFMHKYEDAKGKQVFETLVASIERIGQIGSKETMLDVVNALQ